MLCLLPPDGYISHDNVGRVFLKANLMDSLTMC